MHPANDAWRLRRRKRCFGEAKNSHPLSAAHWGRTASPSQMATPSARKSIRPGAKTSTLSLSAMEDTRRTVGPELRCSVNCSSPAKACAPGAVASSRVAAASGAGVEVMRGRVRRR